MTATMEREVTRATRQRPRVVVNTWMRGADMAKRTCSIDECEMPAHARTWCGAHYARWRRWGDPLGAPPEPDRSCTVDGCEKRKKCRGMCPMHYERWMRHGDLATVLTRRRPLVDRILERVNQHGPVVPGHPEMGACWIWTGQRTISGYGLLSIQTAEGKNTSAVAHRVAYEEFVGPIPDGLELDHVCHTLDASCPGNLCVHRLCANPAHLEPVTHAENVLRAKRGRPRQTECHRGHPLIGENLYVHGGTRHCRACKRLAKRRQKERRAT